MKMLLLVNNMIYLLFSLLSLFTGKVPAAGLFQQSREAEILQTLFRLRNEHKADSAALFYADTVKVYMKYLRNVPKHVITRSDKAFWKAHPGNKFEITSPVQVTLTREGSTVIVKGKEYLDGTSYKYERIEIRFDRNKKIYWYRGYSAKDGG